MSHVHQRMQNSSPSAAMVAGATPIAWRMPVPSPAEGNPGGFTLDGSDPSPVAQAIVKGLSDVSAETR
jgi:hypothetical protein